MPRRLAKFLVIAALVSATGIRARKSPPVDERTLAKNAQTSSPGSSTDFAEARRLLQLGKYEEALAKLKDIETQSEDTPGLAHELGTVYYRKSDYLNSVSYFKKALAVNPADGEATQLLGLSYYLSGNPGGAIPLLEYVQTWYPSANVDASYIFGICYIQTKAYPRARQAFAKMFGVGPDSAASYLFTARMLLRQDFGPVAEEYIQKAVALDAKLPLGPSASWRALSIPIESYRGHRAISKRTGD